MNLGPSITMLLKGGRKCLQSYSNDTQGALLANGESTFTQSL